MSEDINKIEKELLDRLNKLDIETLSALEKYSEEHAKSQRAQTLVSTVIATIAGAAVTSAYIFPEFDKAMLGIASGIFGVFLGFFALRERRKEHSELIRNIIEKEAVLSSIDIEAKKQKIEKIIKGAS